MNTDKEKRYLEISKQLVDLVGGMDNIQGTAHCATRLRIVLKDYDLVNLEGIENVDLVKGQFVAGNQLQIIFGAGLVNDIYDVFSRYTHTENMSLSDIKVQGNKKQNPVQTVIKSLSDVFIDIMPGILAAALLLGVTGVLSNLSIVKNNETFYALNKLASLASAGIFNILPMAVCYSATKRYGGKPILGLIVGAIMLDASLANAYDAAKGLVNPEIISLFGFNVELVGFQGGIIIALMMGFIVAKLDVFFDKKIPDVVKLLVSPLCTVFISTILLFTIVGPVGRVLSNAITYTLIWMTENLGIVGYMVFAGIQQIIVITGLHHIFGAIEAQLIVDTGRNFLNPLMSVALMGQGGAVLGYLILNWKSLKAREMCLPSFASTLFGISEPAIFGINLRYKYPLIAGCLGGALAGGYVYLTDLASLGFGTTAVPGIAIVDPAHNGYMNYIIAHAIALGFGMVFAVLLGSFYNKKTQSVQKEVAINHTPIMVYSCSKGKVKEISLSQDSSFAAKNMGEGIVVDSESGEVFAPCDGKIGFVFPSKHAIGIELANGANILIHCGIDTVQLNGEGFEVFVKEGQVVKQGDLLIRFDKAFIESKGYNSEVIMAYELLGHDVRLTPADQLNDSDVVAIIQ